MNKTPQKKSGNTPSDGGDGFSDNDPFLLEKLFPDAKPLFQAWGAPSAAEPDTLIVLDTNALLLPYEIGVGNLKALASVYEQLAKQNRLFVPERVVREFARQRERKLADMIHALHERKKPLPTSDMPSLLEGTESFKEALASYEALKKARADYVKQLDKLVDEIEEWKGNDPVSQIYSKLFQPKTIIDLPATEDARAELLKECRWRFSQKIPPGYKDGKKIDEGIGDYLIWKSLLTLGEKTKKDLVFVTGEQKGDWFVRTSGSGVYPRPELVDEYRRASVGKSIRLTSLHALLAEMKAPEKVVEEIKTAEHEANTAIQVSNSFGEYKISGSAIGGTITGRKTFDYSTNDGKISIGNGDMQFTLRFSKASDRAIYLRKDDTNLARIARVKRIDGEFANIEDYDSTSRVYTIQTGEYFLAQNDKGRILLGKILQIMDDSREDDHDEISFSYRINIEPGPSVLVA